MNDDWTKDEVTLIVEDYFQMLQHELNRENYNKTGHRKKLIHLLNNRSNGSVEFKHQNISAALIKMGLPYINGYKPRDNYQKQLLEERIANYVTKHQLNLEKNFDRFAEENDVRNLNGKLLYEDIIDTPPKGSIVEEQEPLFRPVKINYLEREQNNRRLGELGESFVIQFEKQRLIKEGKENLVDKIEWVAKDTGDGLGFDILSRNKNGTDRYIEVKTTKLSKETPIFLTKTEISFATKEEPNFFLYRVFNFDKKPRLFIKNGKYDSFCSLIPQTFKGYF